MWGAAKAEPRESFTVEIRIVEKRNYLKLTI